MHEDVSIAGCFFSFFFGSTGDLLCPDGGDDVRGTVSEAGSVGVVSVEGSEGGGEVVSDTAESSRSPYATLASWSVTGDDVTATNARVVVFTKLIVN